MKKVLICEISGRRPGTKKLRPSESFQTEFDKVIISNDSNGYETDWPIVNVPDEYREKYLSNYRTGDAWYAPMNRSYALLYARQHGYDYCVQIDDNIRELEIAFKRDSTGIEQRYQERSRDMFDDFIRLMVCALENSNAVVAGCNLACTMLDGSLLSERYCYSFFTVKLKDCPEAFQGDFEDDIEYRHKCRQIGLPYVQIVPLRYSKTGAKSSKDSTGNRAFYEKAKEKRGATMRRLYGDYYSCGIIHMKSSTIQTTKRIDFKHRMKRWKIGIRWTDREAFYKEFLFVCKKYKSEKNKLAFSKVKRG